MEAGEDWCAPIVLKAIEQSAQRLNFQKTRYKPKCKELTAGGRCSERAEYALFLSERQGLTHLEDDNCKPTRCKKCALDATWRGILKPKQKGKFDGHDEKFKGDIVGFLKGIEAAKYFLLCKEGAPANKYREDGLVVLDADGSAHAISNSMRWRVQNYVASGKVGSLDKLFDSKKYQGNLEGHEKRRWKEIYPGPCRDKARKKDEWSTGFLEEAQRVKLMLQSYFFPNEHYSQVAYNLFLWLTSEHPKAGILNKIQILGTKKINLLVRGKGLDHSQDPHADGEGSNMIVIFITLCGRGGYQFDVVRQSHDLLGKRKKSIPEAAVKSLKLKRQYILVFSECVLHAGGGSSASSDVVDNLREIQLLLPKMKKTGEIYSNFFGTSSKTSKEVPSDMSVQLTFEYAPQPGRGATNEYAKPLWAIQGHEGSVIEFQQGLQRAKGEYRRRLDVGFGQWLNMMVNNIDLGSTKRDTKRPDYYTPS